MGRGVAGFEQGMTQATETNAFDRDDPSTVGADAHPQVTLYWRPGCPFCSYLHDGLDRAGVAHADIDIWDDPAGAAFVRSVANGNETVPTVTVGTTSLVNPTVEEIVALLEDAPTSR